jgi:tetratricopeptide (TPR) repeat protein
MRKFILFLLLLAAGEGFAQSNNVQSAADVLKKYNDLPKAKEYIDLAAANPSTANDPKMWYYFGKVYWAIHRDTTHMVNDPDAVLKAANGFINCLSTDSKNYYRDDCNNMVWVAGIGLFNKAIEAYNKNEFDRATKFYSRVLDIFPLDKDNNLKRNNITSDLVIKNLYQVSYKAKDYPQAKVYLQKLIDNRYNDPMIYIYMSRILLEEKDTAKAITYIEQGRQLFDENANLMNAEMNIYLAMKKLDVLIGKLSAVIETDPENEVLYFKRGFLYENINDRKNAMADYKKALELRDDYFDPNYQLGMLYFTEGAEIANSTSKLKGVDYDNAKKAYEAKFKEAEPYLEKAVDLNPRKTDEQKKLLRNNLDALKQYYARTGQNEKYEQVKAQLDKP